MGIISGFSSGGILFIQNVFTNEVWLRVMAAVGVWAGALVAILTLAIKIWETVTIIKNKIIKK
jgi:hypothetical protein